MPKYALVDVSKLQAKRSSSVQKKKTSLSYLPKKTYKRTSSATYRRPLRLLQRARPTKSTRGSTSSYLTKRRLLKKTQGSKAYRILGSGYGQSLNLDNQWHYETIDVIQQGIIKTIVDSAGTGELGFGVNLAPTINNIGSAGQAAGNPSVYTYRTYGAGTDFRFRTYQKLFQFMSLTGVDIKLTPEYNNALLSVGPGITTPRLQNLASFVNMSSVDQGLYPPTSEKQLPYLQDYEYVSPLKHDGSWHRYWNLRKYAADPNNKIDWSKTYPNAGFPE